MERRQKWMTGIQPTKRPKKAQKLHNGNEALLATRLCRQRHKKRLLSEEKRLPARAARRYPPPPSRRRRRSPATISKRGELYSEPDLDRKITKNGQPNNNKRRGERCSQKSTIWARPTPRREGLGTRGVERHKAAKSKSHCADGQPE